MRRESVLPAINMSQLSNNLLKIANSSVVQQFLHDCVDELITSTPANFDNYNSDIEWTLDDFKNAKSYIQNFYRQYLLNQDLELEFEDSIEKEVKKCFEIRKNDIFAVIIKESLVKNGYNLVDNFDWKLKWIIGSSKLPSIREPLVQIDLHYIRENEEKEDLTRDSFSFEVNLEKLDLLIEQLQKLKTDC